MHYKIQRMAAAYALIIALLIFVPLTGLTVASEATHPVNAEIAQLTKSNFSGFVKENDFVLAQFHAPWCGRCKTLAPQFSKLAQQLASEESAIKLAKVDATKEDELSAEYRIDTYPTLIFFNKLKSTPYTGEHKAEEIHSWLLKNTRAQPAKFLNGLPELKAFREANNISVIGFFTSPQSAALISFFEVAKELENKAFAYTVAEEAFDKYHLTEDSIVVFKEFEEYKAVLNCDFDIATIKRFVQRETLPLIVEFRQSQALLIFEGPFEKHLLLFVPKASSHLASGLEDLAKEYRRKLLFVLVSTDDPQNECILEYFHIDSREGPTMRLMTAPNNMKYKPKTVDFSPKSVKAFLDDFFQGVLKPHLASEPLPADWNQTDVKVLVASNFKEITLDKSKDVLVKFFAPWCGYCRQLLPIYEKLAELYREHKTIVIAKLNSAMNELENIKISSYPTIRLFRKGDNEVIEYKGGRSLQELIEFLDVNCDVESSAETESEIKFNEADTDEEETNPIIMEHKTFKLPEEEVVIDEERPYSAMKEDSFTSPNEAWSAAVAADENHLARKKVLVTEQSDINKDEL